jgi:hypothetical protein
MRHLDTLFQILYAQNRRKYGDVQISFAWRRAKNEVLGYLILPLAAVAMVAIAVAYEITRAGSPAEHNREGLFASVIVIPLFAVLLDRRFRPFLKSPPAIGRSELPAEVRYLLWWRVISVGVFLLVCTTGFVLRRLGFDFMQGI